MPPTRERHGWKRDLSGRRSTKSSQTPIDTPPVPSRWPEVKKAKLDWRPLPAHPHCGFLSLQIPSLRLHIAEEKWILLSPRASIFSPTQAAEEAARLAKADRERAEKVAQHQQEKRERQLLLRQNVAFLTLKYSTDAWEKSELSFVQLEKARRLAKVQQISDRKRQTGGPKLSGLLGGVSASAIPSLSNELRSGKQSPIQASTVLNTLDTKTPGLTDQYTSEASNSSPVTPLSLSSLHCIPSLATEVSRHSRDDLQHPENSNTGDSYSMSGKSSVDTGGVDESIKDVIQNLFVMQQHVASFRPEIQEGLNRKVEDLAVSLQKLDDLVAQSSNPVHSIKIAPDIIDYVDDGRNPDIYTRDFVELVQRGNAVLNGKQRAFRNFSKIYAKALKDNFEGMDEEVDSIMENAGMEEKNGKFVEKHQNGGAA